MDFFGAKNDKREQQGDEAKQGDDGGETTHYYTILVNNG